MAWGITPHREVGRPVPQGGSDMEAAPTSWYSIIRIVVYE